MDFKESLGSRVSVSGKGFGSPKQAWSPWLKVQT